MRVSKINLMCDAADRGMAGPGALQFASTQVRAVVDPEGRSTIAQRFIAGSAIPKWRLFVPEGRLKRASRRGGFTLVEMLVVIGILLVLVTATVAIMPGATESRRLRESARALNIYLSTARSRAMESGSSCGVIIRCLNGNVPCALNVDQCEMPPNYEGGSEQSMAQINGTTVNLFDATGPEALPAGTMRPNDLIQFNHQGVMYSLSGAVDGNGFLTGSSFTIAVAPGYSVATLPTYSQPVSYRIFRSPTKSAVEPLQLPATTVVDLQWSGVGDNAIRRWDTSTAYNIGDKVTYNRAMYYAVRGSAMDINRGNIPSPTSSYWQPYLMGDVTILFSSSGSVEAVNGSPVVDTIYLLVGKRDRVLNDFVPSSPNATTWANVQDPDSIWVTINPHTGMINTEAMGTSDGAANEAAGVVAARAIARSGGGMGGR